MTRGDGEVEEGGSDGEEDVRGRDSRVGRTQACDGAAHASDLREQDLRRTEEEGGWRGGKREEDRKEGGRRGERCERPRQRGSREEVKRRRGRARTWPLWIEMVLVPSVMMSTAPETATTLLSRHAASVQDIAAAESGEVYPYFFASATAAGRASSVTFVLSTPFPPDVLSPDGNSNLHAAACVVPRLMRELDPDDETYDNDGLKTRTTRNLSSDTSSHPPSQPPAHNK